MNREPFEHAPLVEAWLKEPIWLPEGDTARIAQLIHQTPQQRRWWPSLSRKGIGTMFSATKFVAAGVVVAAFVGFLFASGTFSPQPIPPVPAVTLAPTQGPPESAPPSTAVSPLPDVTTPADTAAWGATVLPQTEEIAGAGHRRRGRTGHDGRRGPACLRAHQERGDRALLGTALDQHRRRGLGSRRGPHLGTRPGSLQRGHQRPRGRRRGCRLRARRLRGLWLGAGEAGGGSLTPALWRSADGRSWERVPAPEAFDDRGAMLIGAIAHDHRRLRGRLPPGRHHLREAGPAGGHLVEPRRVDLDARGGR